MIKTFEGLLFAFAETGTEGWLWALQQNFLRKQWSYEDIVIIENKDHLTIYDSNKNKVWSDTIFLKWNSNYDIENIHYWPTNFSKDEWVKIFTAGKDENNYKDGFTGKIIRTTI